MSSKMLDFSSHFLIVEPDLLAGITSLSSVTYIPAGGVDFACKGKVSITQTLQSDDRGPVWRISFRAVTLDNAVRAYDGREVYVGAVMTDGSIRILGDRAEAPRLEVTPYSGANLVTCSLEMPEPVDL